jgi:hypothetical protein
LNAQIEEEEHQNKAQQEIHLVSKSNKGHRFSNERFKKWVPSLFVFYTVQDVKGVKDIYKVIPKLEDWQPTLSK